MKNGTPHSSILQPAVLLLAALWALVFPPPVLADGNKHKEAESHLAEGNRLYGAGEYEAALKQFRAAHLLVKDVKLQVNMGFTLERLGRIPEAAVCFERFLLHRDAAGYPTQAGVVRKRLDRIRRRLGQVVVQCREPGASVTLEGRDVGRTPLGHRLYVWPGRALMEVKKPGFKSRTETLRLRAGELRVFRADIRRAEQKPRIPARAVDARQDPVLAGSAVSRRPIYKRWWFWTAIGVVAAGTTAALLATQLGGDDRTPVGDLGTINVK